MTEISTVVWVMAVIATLILGMAKAGLKGPGVVIVLLFALAFQSKASTGILMPLLIAGDTFAVIYYRRHAAWGILWRLMPWVVIGVLVGVWAGKELDEAQFKLWMAVLILGSTVLMIVGEFRKRVEVPKHGLFGSVMGLLAGFATMIGNLAGPFADLYFLAMRLPKNSFIGTAAWLFFLVNIFKLPFHILVWHTITVDTLILDLWLTPPLILGLWAGVKLVSKIKETPYRIIVIALTAIGAILILVV
jgi:uncharacterized membrane protein YfcA